MATNSYSNLQKGSATWNPALRNFGIVTVMNATVYDTLDGKTMKEFKDLVKSDVDTTDQDTLKALYNMDTTFATRTGTDPDFTYALNEDAVIVTADTIIYMDGKKYEKPKSKEEAFNNLKEMSGKVTFAITGVTIKDTYQDKEICFSDIAEVHIKELSEEDIRWYVENEENLLNISGYVMLGKASIFLDKVIGDYNTLFGISPSKVYEKLKELGYKISDFC